MLLEKNLNNILYLYFGSNLGTYLIIHITIIWIPSLEKKLFVFIAVIV